jgi:hypothetical protein
MDFLSGVQRLRQECSVSGNGPTDVANQTGEMARLVNWYKTACEEIESEYIDWKFLWAAGSITLAQGQSVYTGLDVPSDLNTYDLDTFRLDGNDCLDVYDYSEYEFDAQSTESQPYRIFIQPDNGILVDPVPDQAYTITFDYFKKPSVLAANADTPFIPSQYHRVIWARAMMMYADYEDAPEVMRQGTLLYSKAYEQLKAHQLPNRDQTYGRSDNQEIIVRPE